MLDASAFSTSCCDIIPESSHFRRACNKCIIKLLDLLRCALARIDCGNGCDSKVSFGDGSDVVWRCGGRDAEAPDVMVDAVVVLDDHTQHRACWQCQRLGKSEDHSVCLARIWEDSPAEVWEVGIVVDGMKRAPPLARDVIPCEHRLFKACGCMRELDGAATGAILVDDLPFDFGDDKVAIWCSARTTKRKGWIWQRFEADTGYTVTRRDVDCKGAFGVVWTACKDGIVWPNGEHGVARCGDTCWFYGCPGVCRNISCHGNLETPDVVVIAMGLLEG